MQAETLNIPKLETYKPLKGLYRVCETNPVYDCGWIFVSNEVELEEALEIQERYEKVHKGLTYTIVAICSTTQK